MKQINDLPNELLQKIFKGNLLIKELMCCKQVCKRWKANVDGLKFQRLFIYNSSWYVSILIDRHHFDKQIDLNEFIVQPLVNNQKLLDSIASQRYLFSLKELYINFGMVLHNLNDILATFKRLESLSIDKLMDSICYAFKHSNLQSISMILDAKCSFILFDTPKLKKLKFENSYLPTCVQFVHPNTLTHLECKTYKRWMGSLSGLEYLKCRNINELNERNFKLANLKVLKFRHGVRQFFEWEKMRILRELKKHYDFEIYLNNLHIDNRMLNKADDEFFHYLFNDDCVLKYDMNFLLTAYPNISEELDHKSIAYHDLESYFIRRKFKYSKDFIRRFINLRSIFVNSYFTSVKNKEQLLDLLEVCKCLSVLHFSGIDGLDQEFFDRLPDRCFWINNFKIEESWSHSTNHILNQTYLDHRFLLRFRHLSEVMLDRSKPIKPIKEFDLDLISKLFKRYPFLRRFAVKTTIQSFSITNSNNVYKLFSIFSSESIHTNIDELLIQLQTNQISY